MKKNFIIVVIAIVAGIIILQSTDEKTPKQTKVSVKDPTVTKKPLRLVARVRRSTLTVLDLKQAPESLTDIFSTQLKNSKRVKLVQNLSSDLTEEEREYLYAFVRQTPSDRFTLWMNDEIFCKLENQLKHPEEYEQELFDIATDFKIDGDLRGYAVQHLRSAWSTNGVDKEFVESALLTCLEDTQSDVSGTALLALEGVYRQTERPVEHARILQRAETLALSDTAHLPSRLTALALILQNGEMSQLIIEFANEIILENSSYDTAFKLVAQKILEKE